MATNVNKIDSNITGLRIAEEESINVLPVTPNWVPAEPNDYGDIGSKITTLVRNPITDGRQRKKGVVTDLEASASFGSDFTQTNFQELLKGVFYANYRTKAERTDIPSVTVQAGDDTYELASTTGFLVGSLVFGSKFTNASNSGLHRVTAVDPDVSIAVAETLTTEASPPADSKLVVVGHQFASGDITVDVSGSLPKLVSAAFDMSTLGLTVGEWIYIGGDEEAQNPLNAVNSGFKRIRLIDPDFLELDKSDSTMVTDAGTSKTVRIYFGRKLQNETGVNIVRKTYQLELSLGAPDTAQPSQIQALYMKGCLADKLDISIGTATKITNNISFIATDSETRASTVGLKSGNRPTLEDSDAYNTSSDVKRIKMAKVSNTDEAAAKFFSFVTDLNLSISNNHKPAKAVGVLGAFDISAGTFAVTGDVTAYFTDIEAINSIRNNEDITIDAIVVKDNAGFAIDLPLISLGGGNPNIQLDEAVKLPLTMDAATAASISPDLDYTASITFFDYLPDVAEV
ncbi:phage tail tube protein [Nitrosomonas ureae]|uniref:Uncharacterized protein n=1 Tax=Nitrosomonas ureae TaxID=44577 RepID=A0A1H2EN85_9PROT|nr:phage tail tube protein [Nitrosomonas ureae]ALQ51920.1 hypothetical protein ATY38_12230 [Nitrosomonas ureae]SDT96577.1 hypothetical protein SAMN05216406_11422 [Nitrosomonas ureae]